MVSTTSPHVLVMVCEVADGAGVEGGGVSGATGGAGADGVAGTVVDAGGGTALLVGGSVGLVVAMVPAPFTSAGAELVDPRGAGGAASSTSAEAFSLGGAGSVDAVELVVAGGGNVASLDTAGAPGCAGMLVSARATEPAPTSNTAPVALAANLRRQRARCIDGPIARSALCAVCGCESVDSALRIWSSSRLTASLSRRR